MKSTNGQSGHPSMNGCREPSEKITESIMQGLDHLAEKMELQTKPCNRTYSDRHVGVFIGRFQPFHLGHSLIVKDALENGIKSIKIFVGSANSGRTIKNPFTIEERFNMITLAISGLFDQLGYQAIAIIPNVDKVTWTVTGKRWGRDKITIELYPSNDYLYNDDRWKLEILAYLYPEQKQKFSPKYVLLGYQKDRSSWYLDQFPEFEKALIGASRLITRCSNQIIDATYIRDLYFSGYPYDLVKWDHLLSLKVIAFLEIFRIDKDKYPKLQEEFQCIRMYKEAWKNSPYPPIFVTTDALVQQGNHILLIQRKDSPGKDTWAMPGGFIDQNETLERSMIRELREETGLKIPEQVIQGSIVRREVIDNPDRSSRGRTITHVYHVKLTRLTQGLPAIKSGSDAKNAVWFPLQEVAKMKAQMFEDHWDIISKLIGF